MSDDRTAVEEYVSLYRQAFREYRVRCLWNSRVLDHPTAGDALSVARALRLYGDRSARFLAERLELACRAAL
ncbi:MAG TPA: hypothetical protein VHW66_12315 [Stellaceae bacterium]|jgi:hypothetical protein|nr:hypothetical protein [Stellaceae bacterium]